MQVRLREKIERKEGNEITDSTEIQEEEYWMMVTCVNGRVKNESEWDLLCLINKKRVAVTMRYYGIWYWA